MEAFHVKYRPTSFDDVIGQDAAVRALERIVKDKRAHTFLLSGPAGTGKTTLARILARELAGDKAIGIIEHDAASQSGKDQIKALVKSLSYKALGKSPVKFVILDECHKLTSDAWTVLLKPAEEPPAHVYFAFCTTEMGKVPKPIVTRCNRFDLKPVGDEEILGLLIKVLDSENLECSDEILEAIADASFGSPRQALVYLENCIGCASVAEARQIMRQAGQSKEIVDLARWLVNIALGKSTGTWKEATKYLKALEGTEAESCRIVLVNYFAAVLLNQTTDKGAKSLLALLECFRTPFSASDKAAPLLLAVGFAIGLDS
jgi:DNA polymerase-3 subunit gamma/tau